MGKAQILEAIGNFLVKPEKFLTVHKNPVRIKEFTCALKDGELTAQAEASLGDASLFIERLLQLQRGKAKNEVFTLFDNLASVQQIQNRSKGALSINTKILRGLKKAEGRVTAGADVRGKAADGRSSSPRPYFVSCRSRRAGS